MRRNSNKGKLKLLIWPVFETLPERGIAVITASFLRGLGCVYVFSGVKLGSSFESGG